MKQSGMPSAGMGPGMSNGLNGIMTGKGSMPRVDPRMGSGHISFGVDAYNAFRGMFENSGPIGMNIGAGLSGSGLIGQGYSAPMRSSGSVGLPVGAESPGAGREISHWASCSVQPGTVVCRKASHRPFSYLVAKTANVVMISESREPESKPRP